MKNKVIYYFLGVLLVCSIFSPHFLFASAKSTPPSANNYSCFVYFTGVGCPHCARTDPVVLEKTLASQPNLITLEYEIYKEKVNAPLITSYNDRYHTGLGIPLLIASPQEKILGDSPILDNIKSFIKENPNNPCLLINGSSSFSKIDIDSLPGKPKFWRWNRSLISLKENNKTGGEEAKKYFLSSNVYLSSFFAHDNSFQKLTNVVAPLSGRNVTFAHGVKIGSWTLAWNNSSSEPQINGTNTHNGTSSSSIASKLPHNSQAASVISWAKIISLASVDAINPCALAVLALMLSAILIYNPRKKKDVLLAGFAFISAVFIFYLLYGVLIIKAFKFISDTALFRIWLYRILAGAAIFLGALELKDFLNYHPGGFATEMPLTLRPKVKKIISGITSPSSAFAIGTFVTFFLLPCTIGPYIIAGGLLAQRAQLVSVLTRLLVYNLIFISPMITIVIVVYEGTHVIKDINQWRRKNVRQLHLAAGLILVVLGIIMLLGV